MAWFLYASINTDEEQRVEAAKIGPTCKGRKKKTKGQQAMQFRVAAMRIREGEGGGYMSGHRVRDMFMKCLVVKSITQVLKKPKDG